MQLVRHKGRVMKFDNYLTDAVVLREIGARIKQKRLEADFTQAELAEQAGLAKRTLERLEGGWNVDSLALVRVFRALKMISNLENVLPDTPQSPITLLKRRGRERVRVRAAQTAKEAPHQDEARWKWGK